jgi:hypothetical protein
MYAASEAEEDASTPDTKWYEPAWVTDASARERAQRGRGTGRTSFWPRAPLTTWQRSGGPSSRKVPAGRSAGLRVEEWRQSRTENVCSCYKRFAELYLRGLCEQHAGETTASN